MRRLLVVLLAFGAIAAPALAAGAWNKEAYLAEGFHEATGPSVAVAPNGAAVAGWQAQYDGGLSNVDAFLTARAPGTAPFATGGTRQHVDSAKAHDEGGMHMTSAVNAAGKAVVAWRQATFNGDFRIQAVVRAAGASSFGAVQTLTEEGEDASVPTVAMNASGAAVLVWRRHATATESWQVQGASLSAAGTTFSALNGGGNISSDPDDDSDDVLSPEVRVAIAPSGAAVVAWQDRTTVSLGKTHWSRKGPADSAFGTVHDLATGTWQSDVAAGAGGDFALTWITGSGGTGSTLSLARATTGDFGSATPVASSSVAVTEGRVGLDAAGNAMVAVGAITPGGTQPRLGVTICAATCPAPAWLTPEERRVEGIDLAVNDAGDAVAAWTRSNGTRDLVEAALRAHGKAFAPAAFVSRTDQAAHAATVGIDSGGHATMAWTAANVALFAVRQATGTVDGAATVGPTPTPTPTPTPSGPSGGGGGSPSPPPPPPAAADRAVAASAKLAKQTKATKAGRFSGPKITCSETAGACRVAITFATKKKGERIVAARAKVTIKAGKRATPSLKLLKPAKALLAKQHKLALTGTVKITDAAGNTRSFSVKTRLAARH